jgi:hypothetical protein
MDLNDDSEEAIGSQKETHDFGNKAVSQDQSNVDESK